MSARRWVIGFLGAALVAGLFASPASPASSVAAQIRKVDRRVTALFQLVRLQSVRSEVRSDRFSAPGGAVRARANCEAGEAVTGGGASFDFPEITDRMAYSRPTLDERGWEISISRNQAGDGGTATVYVMCARIP